MLTHWRYWGSLASLASMILVLCFVDAVADSEPVKKPPVIGKPAPPIQPAVRNYLLSVQKKEKFPNAARPEASPVSTEKGLSVTLQPEKNEFAGNGPVAFRVVLKNDSEKPFLLYDVHRLGENARLVLSNQGNANQWAISIKKPSDQRDNSTTLKPGESVAYSAVITQVLQIQPRPRPIPFPQPIPRPLPIEKGPAIQPVPEKPAPRQKIKPRGATVKQGQIKKGQVKPIRIKRAQAQPNPVRIQKLQGRRIVVQPQQVQVQPIPGRRIQVQPKAVQPKKGQPIQVKPLPADRRPIRPPIAVGPVMPVGMGDVRAQLFLEFQRSPLEKKFEHPHWIGKIATKTADFKLGKPVPQPIQPPIIGPPVILPPQGPLTKEQAIQQAAAAAERALQANYRPVPNFKPAKTDKWIAQPAKTAEVTKLKQGGWKVQWTLFPKSGHSYNVVVLVGANGGAQVREVFTGYSP